MSTPNTSNPSQPSSASKKHGGHVSTPARLPYTSPAPRSVPSPAATRKDQAGKTPVNHPTTGSSQGSKTLGGTPMMPTLSQTSNNALGTSPGILTGGSATGGGILSFGTPMGLGVEGITPSGSMMNLPMHPQGGTAMMPTMSDLGLTLSGGLKRNEDEERKAKLRHILQRIGRDSHMGRVSEEGIARVARRVGFANDIDAETLTPEERVRKVGNRAISIAGNGIVVDVHMKKGEVREVQVVFDSTNAVLAEQRAPEVSKVLLRDLKRKRVNGEGEDTSLGRGPRLDKFATNMERLARVDRLGLNSVNCFEALSGVYECLERLHKAEAKEMENTDGDGGAWEAMRKRSGKPKINTEGRLGLWLEYWRDDQPPTPKRRTLGEDLKMADVDSAENSLIEDPSDQAHEDAPNDEGTFRLHIEPEASIPTIYPPLRISDLWIPKPLELPSSTAAAKNDTNGDANGGPQGIPWEDPMPTFVPPGNPAPSGPDAMAVDGSSEAKLPDIRFVARLDPPIVIPYNPAAAVYGAVGVPPPNIFQGSPHYQTLLLNPAATLGTPLMNQTILSGEQTVTVIQDGEETTARHRYVVEVAKPEFGVRIEALPFEHPRQLVELLPCLRQWASFGSLLKNAVQPGAGDMAEAGLNGDFGTQSRPVHQLSLAELLTPPATPAPSSTTTQGSLPVNIALSTTPLPTLGLEIPTLRGGVESVSVRVGLNGELSVTSSQDDEDGHETDEDTKPPNSSKRAVQLATALDMCGGDLGVWVEWLKRRTTA